MSYVLCLDSSSYSKVSLRSCTISSNSLWLFWLPRGISNVLMLRRVNEVFSIYDMHSLRTMTFVIRILFSSFFFCCYSKIPFQKQEPNSCLLYLNNDYCVQAVLLQGRSAVSVLSDLQEILGLVTQQDGWRRIEHAPVKCTSWIKTKLVLNSNYPFAFLWNISTLPAFPYLHFMLLGARFIFKKK